MLEDGMSPKEIKSELKHDGIEVTSQYVYNVKRSWASKSKNTEKRHKDDEDEDDDTEDEDDEDYLPEYQRKSKRTETLKATNAGLVGRHGLLQVANIRISVPVVGLNLNEFLRNGGVFTENGVNWND